MPSSNTITRIGIDIGGTFTDFVIFHPASGSITTYKVPSTPENPALAVLSGLQKLLLSGEDLQIIHGSTVATNALLERKGAATALVTTSGFRDVLRIGRQNRPALYDLHFEPAPPLVAEELCFELDERVDHLGEVLTPLDQSKVDRLVEDLQPVHPEVVAVCFLFSFLHPQHERQVSQRLRQAGYLVSASSEILPEFREYERASTTVVNAYVTPVIDRYLGSLEGGLAAGANHHHRLRVMQSNGGMISPAEARRQAVRCILSGPAGGIVGARYLAGLAFQHESDAGARIITFDMGGTSTDVSLVDGAPKITTESSVGGVPIRVPVLDIHTIGAGGGSIASIDPGGALRVGPQSAGASPGPACYGKGNAPTVTDANLILGRLDAELFLGGAMPLDASRAQQAIETLAGPLDLTPDHAALGVIEIANTHMERALRLISVERGYDPADFILFAFGGAGGLHATELARRLGIRRVLISPVASTLSAFGMLCANVVRDYTQTVMLSGAIERRALEQLFAPMLQRGAEAVLGEGIPKEDLVLEQMMDMRYRGQSYELSVPLIDDYIERFHGSHQKAYGYRRSDTPVEIVNLRVRATGLVLPPSLVPQPRVSEDPDHAYLGPRLVRMQAGERSIPAYRGELLLPGNHLPGPALVLRADTAVLLGSGDLGEVDGYNNLMINIGYTQSAP